VGAVAPSGCALRAQPEGEPGERHYRLMMKNIYEILNNGKSKKHLLLGNGFSIAANALKQSRICQKKN
ncbi:MAG TPA: hypothetical protein PK899_12935, partial [Spirochaetota bacterium]|nr:hypothetical protein [Spirochaetota bacterium]